VARTMTWSSRRPLFPCFLIVFDLIFNNSIFCLSIWTIPWPFLTHLWITTELTRIDQLQLLKVFIDGQFATWRNRDPSHPFSPTAHICSYSWSVCLFCLFQSSCFNHVSRT
jgi:hypothetical protein